MFILSPHINSLLQSTRLLAHERLCSPSRRHQIPDEAAPRVTRTSTQATQSFPTISGHRVDIARGRATHSDLYPPSVG
jgi:hypothetical protein